MALATTLGVDHLPLGERPQYGMPYPEGIAIASSEVADDASGGSHTFSISADPGFLYRLELVTWIRGESTSRNLHCITVHRWANAKRPNVNSALDLNWILEPTALGASFTVYALVGGGSTDGNSESPMVQLRRFPMGPALGGGAPGVAAQLMAFTNDVNTTGITNNLVVVWTYWKKESLYLPGFLSSFYEAPAVPPILR